MSVTEHYQHDRKEDTVEIRTSDIIDFFRNNRNRIIIGGVIGLIVGVLYAFSKPDVYTAQVSVMPEIQAKGSGGLGGLGSLAGLAGISIDNLGAQDAIRPDLYPTILQSVPFALHLLNQPISSKKFDSRLSLQAYMNETDRSWFNSFFGSNESNKKPFIKSLPSSTMIEVTKEQSDIIKVIQADVNGTCDKKTGILIISATEPEAVVAAEVAQNSLEYLANYITTYRTEKSRRQVDFLRRQVGEAKNRYQAAEYALSTYRDSNRAVYLNTAKIEEQRLQADYLLTQSVYNELSKQLEQARIKVQEETPVFKTLEPATVPLQKSGPKRLVIMLVCVIVGIGVVVATQLTKAFLRLNALEKP